MPKVIAITSKYSPSRLRTVRPSTAPSRQNPRQRSLTFPRLAPARSTGTREHSSLDINRKEKNHEADGHRRVVVFLARSRPLTPTIVVLAVFESGKPAVVKQGGFLLVVPSHTQQLARHRFGLGQTGLAITNASQVCEVRVAVGHVWALPIGHLTATIRIDDYTVRRLSDSSLPIPQVRKSADNWQRKLCRIGRLVDHALS